MADDALPPHMVLSKLEEKEKVRLTNRLSGIVAKREELQKALDQALIRLESLDRQRRQAFSGGVRAAELVALNAARQELVALTGAIHEQLAELAGTEKEVVRQMVACENKAKVYARVQQKHEARQARRMSRSEQQKLDDVMAHRRMRRS